MNIDTAASLSPGIALQSTSSMSAIARGHFEANTDARRFDCLVLVELLLIYHWITVYLSLNYYCFFNFACWIFKFCVLDFHIVRLVCSHFACCGC